MDLKSAFKEYKIIKAHINNKTCSIYYLYKLGTKNTTGVVTGIV